MQIPPGFYTVTRVSVETGLSDRAIRDMCATGAINGARRHGRRAWIVPTIFVRGYLEPKGPCPTCGRFADGADNDARMRENRR